MKDDGIVGVVLAGGESSRMGRNKALLPIGGVQMIQVVAHLLRDMFEQVVVVADKKVEYEFLNLPLFHDVFKSSGPLGGIHSAFHHTRADALFVSACDTPFITKELITYLISDKSHLARVASLDGRIHPLPGLYRKEIVPELERSLSAGNPKATDLLHRVGADIVPLTPDLPFYQQSLLSNINEPSEYERMKERDQSGRTTNGWRN